MRFRDVNRAAPAQRFRAVTPSDTDDLPIVEGARCGGLYSGAGGTFVCQDCSGTSTTIAIPAGGVFPGEVSRVLATGTTGSVIALY